MLNKVSAFLRSHGLVTAGDAVVCAVSGGADSVALLFALYLLREKLQISLSAAHFNHGLRGAESDGDQRFVEDFCRQYEIPLYLGSAHVTPGKKGLEAAARKARYDFFETFLYSEKQQEMADAFGSALRNSFELQKTGAVQMG